MDDIRFFDTNLSSKIVPSLAEVIGTGMISEGVKVAEFERLLGEYLKTDNIFTVNSGTSALHLACVLAGIKAGDEVIIPAQTFIATGLVVLYLGAKVVFADISPEDGNITAESIKNKITDRTKAVIVVHWAGYPADMDSICSLAKKYNLKVIEDCAHSFGAKYKGELVYAGSDYKCFSFQAIKILTTADGGAVICKDNTKHKSGKKLRWFGIDREEDKTGFLGEREYNLEEIGFKYHMNDVAATIGINNLRQINDDLMCRKFIAYRYNTALGNIPGITLLKRERDRETSNWLYPILVDNRDEFVQKMRMVRVPVSVVHRGIDRNSIFGGYRSDLSGQRYFDLHQIHLPIHSKLRIEQIQYIINCIKSGW